MNISDKFFEQYAIPGHPLNDEALQLFRLITHSIGSKYGAIDVFFDRAENKAQGLPPKPKKWIEEIKELGVNFPLRIYCYRLTEQIVILFNGGVKDARSAQESSNLSMKFYEAQTFVQKIEDAFQSKMVVISKDGRYLLSFDGTTEIEL